MAATTVPATSKKLTLIHVKCEPRKGELEFQQKREYEGRAKALGKQEEANTMQMQYVRSREEFEDEARRERKMSETVENLRKDIAQDKQRIETRRKGTFCLTHTGIFICSCPSYRHESSTVMTDIFCRSR